MPLLTLPPELLILIADFLPVADLLQLPLTCSYLYHLLPYPTHRQLLDAETSDWARHRQLFACRYCLRLRHAAFFADRMLCRRRMPAGRDSCKRFCIECGLMPREGTARYGPGAQVFFQDHFYVFCLSCHQFLPGARDRYGRTTLECISCWRQHDSQSAAARPQVGPPRSRGSSPLITASTR